MDEKLALMEGKLDSIEFRLNKTDLKIDQIYQRLVGSELFPTGVVKEINDLRMEIESLKRFKMKIVYTISGFIALGGLLGFLANLIYNWISKR